MTDRLLDFANHRWAAPVLRALNLPQPQPLQRRTTAWAAQEHAGRNALVLEAPGGFAAEAARDALATSGADLAAAGALHAIVFDATGCTTTAALDGLHAQLPQALARLGPGGRVVLLADAAPVTPEAAACAAAVAGFVRSLGKELGRRGATANLLSLTDAALPALEGALAFFATDRGAYVGGQGLRLQEPLGADTALAGRTAIVTGAAGGIGAATARRLAAEGAFVLCVDVPSAGDALRALAGEIGGPALAFDITAPDAARYLLQAVEPRGGIDVLVHNAGITRDRTLGRMSAEEWERVLAVNLRAVLALDAAFDAAGALRLGAREICIASIAGIAGNAGQTHYAASKAALIGYVQARNRMLETHGLRINAVAPGFIETAMTQAVPLMTREVGRRLNALTQGGQPEDVAEAVAFLAHPASAGLRGQTLRVCGQSFLGA